MIISVFRLTFFSILVFEGVDAIDFEELGKAVRQSYCDIKVVEVLRKFTNFTGCTWWALSYLKKKSYSASSACGAQQPVMLWV